MIRDLFGGVALAAAVLGAGTVLGGATPEPPDDGSVLPFPPQSMAGVAKPRLQDSTMQWPKEPQRLPADAPNILIVLLDDVGFGVAEPFGGEVQTPTLSKLAAEGLR
jgi:arylsulfatase